MYAVTETDTDKEEYWELKEDAAKEEEEEAYLPSKECFYVKSVCAS